WAGRWLVRSRSAIGPRPGVAGQLRRDGLSAPALPDNGGGRLRQRSRKSPAESSAGQNGGGAMAKTRYAPDRGLIARMGLTMFLLGVVFVAFILALVLVLQASHRGSGAGIVILPVLLAIGLGFGSFYWSDKIALRTAGARLVTPQDGPQAAQLHGVVDRICALADM